MIKTLSGFFKILRAGRKKKAGYSLIETVISMFLISLVLTGGITFYLHSQEVQARAVHKKIVNELLNAKLEALKNTGFYNLTPGNTQINIIEGLSAQQVVTVTDIDDPVGGNIDYKQVEVSDSWTEPTQGTKNMVFNAVTYIAP